MTQPPPPPGYGPPPPHDHGAQYPPPHGSQPPHGYYPPPSYYSPVPPTNAFAIISLVLGIIGGSVLGIIFGFIAISQINQRGERGQGMAIAGLVLSFLWLFVLIAILAAS